MAISGNTALTHITTPEEGVAELKQSLFDIYDGTGELKADEKIVSLRTPADRFTNDVNTLKDAKEQTKRDTMAAKTTRPHSAEVTDMVAEGLLSAEAILSQSVITPTGTQTVCALEINADTLALFTSLRKLPLSADHYKLADFVPQLQRLYGGKSAWPNAAQFNNYFAMLSPLRISNYVPYCDDLQDFNEDQVLECFVPFVNVDGFPTISGVPVWERQEWESIEYYNAFKLYRDMRYAFYNEADMLLTSRSFMTLSKAIKVPSRLLNYLAQVYHWQLRCELYDTWMAQQQKMRQSIKRELLLDRHTKISQALIQKAYSCLSKNAEKMSPKDAIAMLELGLKYERLSQGMPADKLEQAQVGSTSHSINIVNQTNAGNGAMQVAPGSPQQQLKDDMKKPGTLLSVLAVLQRSNALDTLVKEQAREAEAADLAADEVLELIPVDEAEVEGAKLKTSSPGFVFNEVPKEDGGAAHE